MNVDFDKMISKAKLNSREKLKECLLYIQKRKPTLITNYEILTAMICDCNKNNYIYIIDKIVLFNNNLMFFNFLSNKIIKKLTLYLCYDLKNKIIKLKD